MDTTQAEVQTPIRKDRGRTWKERLYFAGVASGVGFATEIAFPGALTGTTGLTGTAAQVALAGAFALAGFALSTPYTAARRVIGCTTARRSRARNRGRERSEGGSETHRTASAWQSHEETHQAGRMRVYRLSSNEDGAAVVALASSAEEQEELRVVVAAAKDGGAALVVEHDKRGGIRKAFHESGRQLFGEIDRPSQPRGLPLTRETVENGERIIETFHADGRRTTRKSRAGRVLKSYPIYGPDTTHRHSVVEQ